MWLKELGNLYTEAWGPSSPNMPGDARGMLPARETKDSIRMKGIFGAGDSPANMASLSQASGQNPTEQEEDQLISKNTVLSLIDKHLAHLDSKNQLDKSGVLHLGKLKANIKGL